MAFVANAAQMATIIVPFTYEVMLEDVIPVRVVNCGLCNVAPRVELQLVV
jgi:hypothetical protein